LQQRRFRVSTGTAASGVEGLGFERIFFFGNLILSSLDTFGLTRQTPKFPVQIRIDPSSESKGGSGEISRPVHLQLFFLCFILVVVECSCWVVFVYQNLGLQSYLIA
jgi:hypothetical protein